MPQERRRRSDVTRLAGREYAGRSTMPENRYERSDGSAGYTRRRQTGEHFYDDLAKPERYPSRNNPKRKKKKQSGAWTFLTVLFSVSLILLGLLMMPQLLGIHIPGLPAIAFNGGRMITYDEEKVGNFRTAKAYMTSDTFYPGVTVDGVDLSGMTMAQAKEAVGSADASEAGDFSYEIRIDSQTWTIDSDMVSRSRNVDELLAKAWAVGRCNTTSLRSSGTTPFQERLNQVNTVIQSPQNWSSALSYDKSQIRALVNAIADQVCVDPVNASVASFDFGSKSFSFNADSSGITMDADGLYNQILSRLENGERNATITVSTEKVLADVTKSELMNNFCRISRYSTKTTDNKNRNTNIKLAAEAINGMVVMPGETFSFNSATGQRTEEKGYKPAAAISGGTTSDEIGGGVCQVSSTLFNAVARANLEIVSRTPHAWPSTYVSEGMDATVNWPSLDFKWRNNSDWPVYIVAWYSDRHVYVELYGYGLGDGLSIDLESIKTKTLQAPSEKKMVQNTELPAGTEKTTVKKRDGSVWETYQVWYQNGKEVKRELLCTSTYKAYQETIEYN